MQESWVQPEFAVFDLKLAPSLDDAAPTIHERSLARLEGSNLCVPFFERVNR